MKSKYTKEFLSPIIEESKSWADVLRKVGVKYTGGNLRYLKSKVNQAELSTEHFKKGPWNKGETKDSHSSVGSYSKALSIPNEEVFKVDGHPLKSTSMVKRLLAMGWEYKCSCCELDSWMGKPLTLHLDHINGIHTDNRFENLRFLCPNCHQQTDTWGNKKVA